MIWRLPHPVLGLLTGLAVALGLVQAFGFGVGWAEIVAIAIVSTTVTLAVGGWRPTSSR